MSLATYGRCRAQHGKLCVILERRAALSESEHAANWILEALNVSQRKAVPNVGSQFAIVDALAAAVDSEHTQRL